MSKSKSNRSARRDRSKTKSSILPIVSLGEETEFEATATPSRSSEFDIDAANFFDEPIVPAQSNLQTDRAIGRSPVGQRSTAFTPSFSFDLESEGRELHVADRSEFNPEISSSLPAASEEAPSEMEHSNNEPTPILTVPSTKSTKKKTSSKKSASKKAKKKASTKSSKPAPAENAQVSLLSDFWTELGKEEADKEEDRFNEFFEDSVHNTKSSARDQEDSVSKRIQVGLYPADAELLEELFLQSKAAGLKNVSRARILRVALRHFHTCWLNADQSS